MELQKYVQLEVRSWKLEVGSMKNIYENEMKLEFVSKSNNEAFARISVAAFAARVRPYNRRNCRY